MAWFEGTHTETRTLTHPLSEVRAHFSNLETIATHTKGLESSEITDDVLHFVMKEENHGFVTFKGDFCCRYTLNEDTLSWSTVTGNMKQSGTAQFREEAGKTILEYTETVAVDLGVPDMMAPMLKPVISAMLAGEVKDYVKRMSVAL